MEKKKIVRIRKKVMAGRAAYRRRAKLLSTSLTSFAIGIVLLIPLFSVQAYSSTIETKTAALANLSPAAITGMLADNVFIIVVLFAVLAVLYQSVVLRQIKDKIN
ncbi:MAG: hypothetical protein ABIH66_10960 [bacterium]